MRTNVSILITGSIGSFDRTFVSIINIEDAPHTYEYPGHYKILPPIFNWGQDPALINSGKPVVLGLVTPWTTNTEWMTIDVLRGWIGAYREKSGLI